MIKNENDLLGLLIKLKDENGDVRNEILLNETDLDPLSIEHLMQGLIKNRYVIYTFDTTTVTRLGESNYVPPAKKVFLRIRDIVLYLLGVITPYLVEAGAEIVKSFLSST